jgi:response regulator of citrate/malate metabolism
LATRLAAFVQIDVYGAVTLAEAEAWLQGTGSRVLLADASIERPGWEDALQMASHLPFQVALVLVSPIADRQFWIDALECGVYDLILEPLRVDELWHVLEGAHFRATSGGSSQLLVPSLARHELSAPPVREQLLCTCP